MKAEAMSGRERLKAWVNGGDLLQLVVSARDGMPSFSTVAQLTSVDPARVEATVPDVPVVKFEFILSPDAVVSNGEPEAGSKPISQRHISLI
jgi:hypothetical protein